MGKFESSTMSRGRQKFAGQKRHGFLLRPPGTELEPNQIGNLLGIPKLNSVCRSSFPEVKLSALEKRNVPPVLACKFLPSPGQQPKLSEAPVQFFHTFPFSKGEVLSPPFVKGGWEGFLDIFSSLN
jgi:hypothetical protein